MTTATTTRRAVAAVACALAVLPTEAGAHGEASPLVRSVVDAVEPRTPGVSFTPVRGPAAQVLVRNRTRADVEILDERRRPFLRIGPRGTFGNAATAAFWASGNPDGEGVPPTLDERRGPRWRLLARRRSWTYYEHRLHPRQARLPPKVRGARRPVRLRGFSVPLRHGGRHGRVRGHLEFRPIRGAVVPALRSSGRPLPGVAVTVLPGMFPAMLLQNTSRTAVTVLGRDGEPFARIGPRGAEVNVRSPIHVEDLRQRGDLPEVPADPRAAPRWRRVGPVPSLTWTEPRVRYPLEQPPDAVVGAERRLRLLSWRVPLRAGAREADVRGTTDWVPTEATGAPREGAADGRAGGGIPVRGVLLGALALAVLVGGAIVVRARAGAG